MVLINLSRGRQPVALERFHKNTPLAWFYRSLGQAVPWRSTPSIYYFFYLFEKLASEDLWSRWHPLCSIHSTSVRVVPFRIKEGTGAIWLSQLRKPFEVGSQGYLARLVHES